MNEFGGVTGEEAMRGFEAGRHLLAAGGFTIGGGGAVDDLSAFVRQQLDARERQLDEDERVARAAGAVHAGQQWTGGVDDIDLPYVVGEVRLDSRPSVAQPETAAIASHIARWDPARVLDEVKTGRAEVEAKRRILDMYDGACAEVRSFVSADQRMAARVAQFQLEAVVRSLAQPYAGRPGWREEWRV